MATFHSKKDATLVITNKLRDAYMHNVKFTNAAGVEINKSVYDLHLTAHYATGSSPVRIPVHQSRFYAKVLLKKAAELQAKEKNAEPQAKEQAVSSEDVDDSTDGTTPKSDEPVEVVEEVATISLDPRDYPAFTPLEKKNEVVLSSFVFPGDKDALAAIASISKENASVRNSYVMGRRYTPSLYNNFQMDSQVSLTPSVRKDKDGNYVSCVDAVADALADELGLIPKSADVLREISFRSFTTWTYKYTLRVSDLESTRGVSQNQLRNDGKTDEECATFLEYLSSSDRKNIHMKVVVVIQMPDHVEFKINANVEAGEDPNACVRRVLAQEFAVRTRVNLATKRQPKPNQVLTCVPTYIVNINDLDFYTNNSTSDATGGEATSAVTGAIIPAVAETHDFPEKAQRKAQVFVFGDLESIRSKLGHVHSLRSNNLDHVDGITLTPVNALIKTIHGSAIRSASRQTVNEALRSHGLQNSTNALKSAFDTIAEELCSREKGMPSMESLHTALYFDENGDLQDMKSGESNQNNNNTQSNAHNNNSSNNGESVPTTPVSDAATPTDLQESDGWTSVAAPKKTKGKGRK